jgi:hypothetical protein
MKIIIPLVYKPNSSVISYPGNVAAWSNTIVHGSSIAGDYSDSLYMADGVTKTFDWEPYSPAEQDYGTLISNLAFFERMRDAEEDFLRVSAKTNIQFEKLLARTEKIAEAIDLQRIDVRAGVVKVLAAMVSSGVDGYTEAYALQRHNEILNTKVVFSELPSLIKTQFTF